MKQWDLYTSESKKQKFNDSNSRHIVEVLGELKTFFCSGQTKRTELIKSVLATLGDERERKPHYQVYANRLDSKLRRSDGKKFVKREWLYDLHWYVDRAGYEYQPERLILAVECEWEHRRRGTKKDKKDPYGAIKYDFQKLLAANAELRLMIFRIRKRNPKGELEDLDAYFDEAIESYANLPLESKFLFIAFDEKEQNLRYTEKSRGGKKLTVDIQRLGN